MSAPPRKFNFEGAPFATPVFRVQPSVTAKREISLWAGRLWFVLAVPVCALLVVGLLCDWRYAVVALAVVFLIYPGLMLLGWNALLTRPSAVAAIFPQQVTLQPNGSIVVEYQPLPSPPSAEDEKPSSGLPPSKAPNALTINPRTIVHTTYWRKYLVVGYGTHQELFIPQEMLPEGMGEALLQLQPFDF